jgi:AmmeMemoRadiSam system protein A/AmmeMemoRadiSam system protein B
MPIVGAYIVPHPPVIVNEVGQGKEKEIQKTIDAYEEISRRIGEIDPESIVVISPHSIMYSDYIHISPGSSASGSLKQFGAPEVSIHAPYDTELVSTISRIASEMNISAGTLGEKDKKLDHGTLVPLYFINHYLAGYNIVRIGISGLSRNDHYMFGKCIKKAIDALGRKTVIVASGDLSHKLTNDGPYSYAKEGPEFDRIITEAMGKADFLKFLAIEECISDGAGECGLNSFIIMAGALDKTDVEAELLSYEGPFGVGYAVCAYKIVGFNESRNFDEQAKAINSTELNIKKENEDLYVKLARQSLERFVKTRETIKVPEGIPNELLKNKAGVFVTIKKNGRLRGCIGTIFPMESSIAKEIIMNAISSAASDFRFSPVTEDELPELEYSVDVLDKPESIINKDQLDVKRFGVIVSNGHKRGLLLPNLENVTTVEDQISIALEKAGINPQSTYTMERFEVVRHK